MPTIGAMSHGFDEQGIESYLSNLKSIVLTRAAEQIRDITRIENACNENWSGKAKDNYLLLLRRIINYLNKWQLN